MRLWTRSFVGLCLLLVPASARAQHAETPQTLFATDGAAWSAAQIGRRLFIAGSFRRVSAPTGSAIVVDQTGGLVAGAFPKVTGSVHQVINDGVGGWLLVGDFTSVRGHPVARFARVAPDRTVDTRYRIAVSGLVRFVAVVHGRVYLAGDFTTVNGAPRPCGRSIHSRDRTRAGRWYR